MIERKGNESKKGDEKSGKARKKMDQNWKEMMINAKKNSYTVQKANERRR